MPHNCLNFLIHGDIESFFIFPFLSVIRIGGKQYLNHSMSMTHKFSKLPIEEGSAVKLLFFMLIFFKATQAPISFGISSILLLCISSTFRYVSFPMLAGKFSISLFSISSDLRKIHSVICSGNCVNLLLDNFMCFNLLLQL
jgi:hypothetical protein